MAPDRPALVAPHSQDGSRKRLDGPRSRVARTPYPKFDVFRHLLLSSIPLFFHMAGRWIVARTRLSYLGTQLA